MSSRSIVGGDRLGLRCGWQIVVQLKSGFRHLEASNIADCPVCKRLHNNNKMSKSFKHSDSCRNQNQVTHNYSRHCRSHSKPNPQLALEVVSSLYRPASMPARSKHYRHHDDYDSDEDHQYSRGRDRARPRAQHRSSSFDEGYSYGRWPRSTERYYSSDDDNGYHYVDGHDVDARRRRPSPRSKPRSRPRHRHTKSTGHSVSPLPRRRRRSVDSRDSEWEAEVARERKNKAIRSALTAGAVEAMRQRNRPGDWLGAKGVRVATAAMSAAAIDTAVDRNPRKSGKTKLVTSALGGLFVDKLANGLRGR